MCRFPEKSFERHPATGAQPEEDPAAPNSSNRDDPLKDDTVTFVPFCFQLPRLLPKCSRAELLFSTFVQGLQPFLMLKFQLANVQFTIENFFFSKLKKKNEN